MHIFSKSCLNSPSFKSRSSKYTPLSFFNSCINFRRTIGAPVRVASCEMKRILIENGKRVGTLFTAKTFFYKTKWRSKKLAKFEGK